jgi:hypothetical protein
MFPSPASEGGKSFGLGLPTIGCGAQRDLVFARARETRLLLPPSGTQRTRILEPLTPRTGAPAGCSGRGVSDSESAGENLDGGLAVARLPGFYATGENGAIVALTDAVQEMHLDLVRPVLHAKARRRSQKLEQVVSQINGINSQTHRRSSHAIGPRRPQSDRLHEGRLFARANSEPASRDRWRRRFGLLGYSLCDGGDRCCARAHRRCACATVSWTRASLDQLHRYIADSQAEPRNAEARRPFGHRASTVTTSHARPDLSSGDQ